MLEPPVHIKLNHLSRPEIVAICATQLQSEPNEQRAKTDIS